jgi:polyhydroxyalkanoate synthesis regulator phasin
MVKRGEITQQEAPQAVKEMLAKAQEAQQAFWDKSKELVNKLVSEGKLVRAEDLEALENGSPPWKRNWKKPRVRY